MMQQLDATCPKCGRRITSSGHLCDMSSGATLPYNPAWAQGVLSPVIIIDDETKRILERVAVALEKLAAAI